MFLSCIKARCVGWVPQKQIPLLALQCSILVSPAVLVAYSKLISLINTVGLNLGMWVGMWPAASSRLVPFFFLFWSFHECLLTRDGVCLWHDGSVAYIKPFCKPFVTSEEWIWLNWCTTPMEQTCLNDNPFLSHLEPNWLSESRGSESADKCLSQTRAYWRGELFVVFRLLRVSVSHIH